MKIQAVIFDMDGLLIDSEPYWERARAAYCAAQGCDWRAVDELSVKGHNSVEWATVIRHRCSLSASIEAITGSVCDLVEDLYRVEVPLLPGATQAVRDLAPVFPLAIASSSPPRLIEYAMQEAGLFDQFQVIVSADEVGKGKPNPEVFLEAARRLGFASVRIAVFEDSTAGIEASRRAQMFTVAVPNAHYPPTEAALNTANLVLESLQAFDVTMLP